MLVHGRGVTRAETIRAVPVFRAAGYSVVLASWRNDGVAPPSVDGRYGLGSTEWEDVDSVLRWLTAQDAQSVVLMGWSMGGAVVLQTLLRSRFCRAGRRGRARVTRGRLARRPEVAEPAPAPAAAGPARSHSACSGTPVLYRLAGLQRPVDLRELDMVTRADELTVPILLLHSDDDGFVPSSASHDLAPRRPDLVRLEIQTTARHTKLWNHDADWFDARILAWLTEVVQRRGAASAR
ncbi:alpha/beta hydrolase [Curtobacterium flaccumfaciens]|nr:alpha/beta hydrolase [Curtobacterium flaccumfaciens]